MSERLRWPSAVSGEMRTESLSESAIVTLQRLSYDVTAWTRRQEGCVMGVMMNEDEDSEWNEHEMRL